MNKIQTATYYLGLLLCLMSGLLLEACSSDSTSDSRPDNSSSERTVRHSAGARQYHVDDAEMAWALLFQFFHSEESLAAVFSLLLPIHLNNGKLLVSVI